MTVDVAIDRGGEPFKVKHTYKLDGSEVTFETPMRTPHGDVSVPTTTTAKPAAGGALDITLSSNFERNGMRLLRHTKERWTLSEDGKTLNVVCVDQTPRGSVEYTPAAPSVTA